MVEGHGPPWEGNQSSRSSKQRITSQSGFRELAARTTVQLNIRHIHSPTSAAHSTALPAVDRPSPLTLQDIPQRRAKGPVSQVLWILPSCQLILTITGPYVHDRTSYSCGVFHRPPSGFRFLQNTFLNGTTNRSFGRGPFAG